MKIKEFIRNNILILDGGMGTLLQEKGLLPGEEPALWNISHADEIIAVHKAYYDSGSNAVSTNTFGISTLKFPKDVLEEIIVNAVNNCITAQNLSESPQEKFIAFDIGPTGKMLKPYGDLDFEDAVEIFAENVRIADKLDIDFFLIETMTDSYETKAALLAVKENSSKPVFVTNAYGKDGKLLTGATPSAMAAMLEGMGADAVGANCSFGPKATLSVIDELLSSCNVPVILKPNAGLPDFIDGRAVYDLSPDDFSDDILTAVKLGVSVVGGCCGTTPEYISSLADKICGQKKNERSKIRHTVVSSYTHAVIFDNKAVLVGERINPTGKKKFKQALIEHNIDYILGEGIAQQEKGVHVLDVNVGLAGIDESEMLPEVIKALQAVSDLPLQIDSSDYKALESAMRIYNGKPLINSVNGKSDSMRIIFPLVKKYGGVVVALTLDENGIPDNAEGRIRIAENILKTAAEYGISSDDIIFDPLTLTVSTDRNSADTTLECIKILNDRFGCKTILGVSNISFGLPSRDILNSVFFTLALENGLSAAIINPFSDKIMDSYYAFNALKNSDINFDQYISHSSSYSVEEKDRGHENNADLFDSVVRGRKDAAARITVQMLDSEDPMDIINNHIIPALDKTGVEFENGRLFLPQLLMSAEAAAAAFAEIKNVSANSNNEKKCDIVLATVKGDIHDIGKNIVRLLLENYGFNVIDLGKDVSADRILATVKEHNASLLGLSALMTTTLEAMKETVHVVKNECPWCKIFVGGAVVNEEFALSINADKYTVDAMASVRYAEEIWHKA